MKAHIYVCAHDALHARGVMMEERGGSQCLEPCTYEERGVHKEIRGGMHELVQQHTVA